MVGEITDFFSEQLSSFSFQKVLLKVGMLTMLTDKVSPMERQGSNPICFTDRAKKQAASRSKPASSSQTLYPTY